MYKIVYTYIATYQTWEHLAEYSLFKSEHDGITPPLVTHCGNKCTSQCTQAHKETYEQLAQDTQEFPEIEKKKKLVMVMLNI